MAEALISPVSMVALAHTSEARLAGPRLVVRGENALVPRPFVACRPGIHTPAVKKLESVDAKRCLRVHCSQKTTGPGDSSRVEPFHRACHDASVSSSSLSGSPAGQSVATEQRTAGGTEEAPGGTTTRGNSGPSATNGASPGGTSRRALIGGFPLAAALLAGASFGPPGVQSDVQNLGGQDRAGWVARVQGRVQAGLGIEIAEAASGREDRPRDAYDEAKLLEQNRRIQKLNNAPDNFPGFIRDGFEVKVVVGSEWQTSPTGLIYIDLVPGDGPIPSDGQQVTFHYIGYNEQARRVDSTYYNGTPAKTRVGIKGMIPGFEEGIKSIRVGGKRRIVIPPELGPPTGPSTFFSAKQYEVFDIELLATKDCVRRQVLFYSDVVCE